MSYILKETVPSYRYILTWIIYIFNLFHIEDVLSNLRKIESFEISFLKTNINSCRVWLRWILEWTCYEGLVFWFISVNTANHKSHRYWLRIFKGMNINVRRHQTRFLCYYYLPDILLYTMNTIAFYTDNKFQRKLNLSY